MMILLHTDLFKLVNHFLIRLILVSDFHLAFVVQTVRALVLIDWQYLTVYSSCYKKCHAASCMALANWYGLLVFD